MIIAIFLIVFHALSIVFFIAGLIFSNHLSGNEHLAGKNAAYCCVYALFFSASSFSQAICAMLVLILDLIGVVPSHIVLGRLISRSVQTGSYEILSLMWHNIPTPRSDVRFSLCVQLMPAAGITVMQSG